jgi:hypothetical protein
VDITDCAPSGSSSATNTANFDKVHARPDDIKQPQDEYVPVCGSGQVPGG